MTGAEAYLAALFGDELAAFLDHPPIPTFLRVNPARTTPEALARRLAAVGVAVEAHPSSPLALRVERGSPAHFLPHFLGHFAVQSLGSMVPARLLEPAPGDRIADLCAAPGMKTGQLAQMATGGGQVWANDRSGKRMMALAANLDAAGATSVVLLNEPGELLPRIVAGGFDRVLADVPCTGLGRARNVDHFRESFALGRGPRLMAEIQYRLLLAAAKLVRPGGRIVYSTCSLTREENEEIVARVLDRMPLEPVEPPPIDGLVVRPGGLPGTIRIVPHENPTEGFFAAVLTRTGPIPERYAMEPAPGAPPLLEADDPAVGPALAALEATYGLDRASLDRWRFLARGDRVWFVDRSVRAVGPDTHRVGLMLAKWSCRTWRLGHPSVQVLGERIVRGRIELDPERLRRLVEEGSIAFDGPDPGTRYPVLVSPVDGPFAIGILEGDRLRWKPPRSYRIA